VLNIWNVHSRKLVGAHQNVRKGRRWFSNTCALVGGRAFVGSGDGKIIVYAVPEI
jgi:hypothetical protein